MEDKKTEQIREYLKLKKLQAEDKSDDIIEKVYNEVTSEEYVETDERYGK